MAGKPAGAAITAVTPRKARLPGNRSLAAACAIGVPVVEMTAMRGAKNRWPWLAVGIAVTGLAALLAVTAAPLGGENGLQTAANTAQVTAVVIAVGTATAGAVMWAWRTTRRAAAAPSTDILGQAKDVLAGVVAEQWRHEARLRSLDDPDPIPLRWSTPEYDPDMPALMDHPANIKVGAGPEGRLWMTASSAGIPVLADLFRRTRRRRLVILGGPGTGKTTLAMQLLLHLLASRTAGEPVPVLLPVASWDIQRFPRLQDWLADRLAHEYPALHSAALGGDVVRALTERGHILPVLDGLDEHSPSAQARVIIALNRSLADDDQLILTSRTAEFSAAISTAGDVVTSAAVLEPRPLSPAQAADYLARCLPPHPGPAWQRILTELRAVSRPAESAPPQTPGGPAAALAEVVSTPLGLWLVRAVYVDQPTDPAPLLNPASFPTAARLRSHLLDRLIPALLAARPPSGKPGDLFRPRRAYRPADVQRWLTHLAHHLHHLGTRDFAWWHLARHTLRPRTLGAMLGLTYGLAYGVAAGLLAMVISLYRYGPLGVAAALVLVVFFVCAVGLPVGLATAMAAGRWMCPDGGGSRARERVNQLARRLAIGLIVGLPIGLMFSLGGNPSPAAVEETRAAGLFPLPGGAGLTEGLLSGLAAALTPGYWLGHDPAHAELRLRGRVGLLVRRCAVALAGGLGAGLVYGVVLVYVTYASGYGGGWVFGEAIGREGLLGFGLPVGLVFGLIWWARTPVLSDGATTPKSAWRSDRRLTLLRIIAFTGAVELPDIVLGHASMPLATVLAFAIFDFAAYGLFYGIMIGGTNAWICYAAANLRLAVSGRTPIRAMGFLDDAHRLGLVRAVGPVYQFRHAEFQDHLAVGRGGRWS